MLKILELIFYPEAILQQKAKKVSPIPKDIDQLIKQMVLTMQENDGIGLAAPQIDISKQIMVVQDVEDEERTFAFLNPKFVFIFF